VDARYFYDPFLWMKAVAVSPKPRLLRPVSQQDWPLDSGEVYSAAVRAEIGSHDVCFDSVASDIVGC
jgi:hypothetical protein